MSMRHAGRTLLPLLATILLVIGGAGALPARASAAATPSSPALIPLLLAVRATVEKPAAFRVRLTGGSLLGPTAAAVVGAGAFDFAAGRGEVTLASGDPHGTVEAIFTPQVVYIREPVPGGFLPRGRSWLAIDFSNTPALLRNFPQIADQVEAVDPGLVLRELEWGAVTTAGSSAAELGGRQVQRLNVMVDLARGLREVTGPSRSAYTAALQSELAALDTESGSTSTQIAVHVFLTPEGQLLGLELVPPGAASGGVAMTFGDAGIPVHASPPPARQVADLASITPSGERENQNGGDSDGG